MPSSCWSFRGVSQHVKMFLFFLQRGNHTEAAQCLVHSGLLAKYLNMLEDKTHLPEGWVEMFLSCFIEVIMLRLPSA